ncbi:MAG: ribonuclease R [Williamsia sp.]|nr:ribonuclease R [Williamsia sp.]
MKHTNKKNKTHKAGVYAGTLDITRSGMGYVVVENVENDILVRPNDFNTALHGDKVRVSVSEQPARNGRLQGEVIEVLERKQTDFIGRLDISPNFAFFIADADKPMPDVFIPLDKLNGATAQDKVLVRITVWEKKKKPRGEVVQVLDATNQNDLAMQELIMSNGFPINFEEGVLEESERLPDILSQEEISRRRDMRDVLTFTIDPVDAKDFDDAVSFTLLKNGNYEIGIHIADVGFYVEPGSRLDQSAYQRATSVYLPDRVNPMLPERISNELCSLRPHEDKFTFSVVVEMTKNGAIKNKWTGKTAIHSDHRFTYEEVQEIIENGDGLYHREVVILNDLAQRMRKQRFKKGAINFSSTEVRFKLDAAGKPVGIMIKESKESHQLIEEFMLLANRLVAERVAKTKIKKQPVPCPYRVHDTPDEEKLLPFVEFAKKYGHKFDTKTPEGIAESFNGMLKEARGKPEQHVLEQLGIRTMAKAVYTAENIGHYGLGFPYYTHFTSPIRRYPDVLVHRVLEQILTDKVVPDKEMEAKCKHCSDRERAAMETERAANKYKQVEYMQNYLGDEFEGVISGVSSFGFWVETVEHKCEGLVSINSLSEYDNFEHQANEYRLVGRRSGRIFAMGDKIRIKVISANLAKRQLDYEWVLTSSLSEEPFEPVQLKRRKRGDKKDRRGRKNKKKSGA